VWCFAADNFQSIVSHPHHNQQYVHDQGALQYLKQWSIYLDDPGEQNFLGYFALQENPVKTILNYALQVNHVTHTTN